MKPFVVICITYMSLILCITCVVPTPEDKKLPKGVSDEDYKKWLKGLIENIGGAEYKSVDYSKDLESQKITFSLGERTFSMPKVYLATRTERYVKAINLTYMMPDFRTKFLHTREEYMDLFRRGQSGAALVEAEKYATINLAKRIRYYKKEGTAGIYMGMKYGLHFYTSSEDIPSYRRDEFYVEEDVQGNTISYIRCDLDHEGVMPGCSHRFNHQGLRYKIRYRKKNYLPTWKEHHNTAIAFMDRYDITASH